MKLLILLAATLGAAAIAAEPPLPLSPKTAAPKTVKAPNPNLVEAKTSTGKTIHYDCSKKGNINKVACKK